MDQLQPNTNRPADPVEPPATPVDDAVEAAAVLAEEDAAVVDAPPVELGTASGAVLLPLLSTMPQSTVMLRAVRRSVTGTQSVA